MAPQSHDLAFRPSSSTELHEMEREHILAILDSLRFTTRPGGVEFDDPHFWIAELQRRDQAVAKKSIKQVEWWIAAMTIAITLVALGMLTVAPITASAKESANMMNLVLAAGAALFAALAGHWITGPLVRALFHKVSQFEAVGGKVQWEVNQPIIAILGCFERFVYTAGWLFGRPEIILAVLALKAAPQLRLWSERETLGRMFFNIWLIGNLTSVIIAVFVAELIKAAGLVSGP